MQQSNVIFANLFIAYFLFITLKGELPTYLNLLRGGDTTNGSGNVFSGTGALGGTIAAAGNSLISNSNMSASDQASAITSIFDPPDPDF